MKGRGRRPPKIQKTHELSYELKIKEAMNKAVLTLNPNHTMVDVRKVLKNRGISGIPIVAVG